MRSFSQRGIFSRTACAAQILLAFAPGLMLLVALAYVLHPAAATLAAEPPANDDQRRALYEVDGLAELTAADTPLKQGQQIACFGDSITWQDMYLTQIRQALAASEATRDLNVELRNHGINGGGVLAVRDGSKKAAYVNAQQRDGAQASFADVLAADGANAAVVFIGINDVWWRGTKAAEFEQALRDLVKTAQARQIPIVLATLAVKGELPNGKNQMDPQCERFAAITRRVAADTGATLVDLRAAFMTYIEDHNQPQPGDDGTPKFADKGILTYDGVHPNERGNRLIAQLIARGLRQALDAQQTIHIQQEQR